jgi:peptidoglycan/LPS O-acetylase OafA/YrhL
MAAAQHLHTAVPAAGTRDPVIDVLRVACILYIVGYWHLVPYTEAFPGYANSVTECIKDIALGTFVFCSGLLLGGRRLGGDHVSVMRFYGRRVLRIYPLYALAVLLFGVSGLAGHDEVVAALLLVSMFDPPAVYTLWFVSMIMTFYLMTPLWMRLAEVPRYFLTHGLFLLAAAVCVHAWIQPLDARIILYLPCFLSGLAYARWPVIGRMLDGLTLPLLAAFCAAFVLARIDFGADALAVVAGIPVVLAGALLVFRFADRYLGRFGSPGVQRLAYAGFCVYLFHRVIFQWSIGLYFPADGLARLVYLLAVVLPVTLAVGYGIQWTYDRGVQLLARRAILSAPKRLA